MSGTTIYEFDGLTPEDSGIPAAEGLHVVPETTFRWLEDQCVRAGLNEEAVWLRLGQRRGRRVVQVTSFVGVIRAPDGYQIEVLPKVGKVIGGGPTEARRLLIELLSCLPGFRHVQTANAILLAARMPLIEIFITEFLRDVEHLVKRGLRNDYVSRQDNLLTLRGKLLISSHVRQNLFRVDRFFTEHDEFLADRPENRLLHSALRRVLMTSASQANQRLARELDFVFAGIPLSIQPWIDFQRVRFDRSMRHYADALAWARLILDEQSPLTGAGVHSAPSLLFPMESVFEAFVAKHLAGQLASSFTLKTQVRGDHLVRHRGQNWFRLKPDLLVRDGDGDVLVLDTKWKLLNSFQTDGTNKYGLSHTDFYQLRTYGQTYLQGAGDVILIYPRTASFDQPLPVFEFRDAKDLRLWVLPFCLRSRALLVPKEAPFVPMFRERTIA